MKKEITKELFEFDMAFGAEIIAGCDEAGRGPLAGPLVVAACIMPTDNFIDGVNDSKAISEKRREELYEKIVSVALSFSVEIIDVGIIDSINILNATKKGMTDALKKLSLRPTLALVDAVGGLDLPFRYEPIIKGDAKSYAIAAASIIAKVTRDRLMRKLDDKYPDYGFLRNKGYGTAEHIAALKKFGKTPQHRLTFIRNFIGSDYEEIEQA